MDERIAWYRTPIERDVLKALTRQSDARGLLQAGSFLLIFVATLTLSGWFFVHRMWVPMVAMAYVHGMFHGFVGMEAAVHELCHGTAFRTKWLNRFFYRLFCFLSWNNPVHFYASHMKHHQFTVHRGLDKEVVLAPIALTGWDAVQWFTFNFKKFAKIMRPNLAHAAGRGDVDVFFWDPLFPPGDPRRREMCNWARFMFAGHLLLLAVFAYFQLWVLAVLVPLGYFIANFPSQGCGMQQHLGLRPGVPDWRVCCHTVRFDPLMAFLYWQMNHHIEHHMYAAVPFWNVPKLSRALAPDMPIPVRGYLAGIRRILWIRREQQRDPAFVFSPEFPPSATPAKLQ